MNPKSALSLRPEMALHLGARNALRALGLVFAGSALLALSAHIQIPLPFTPVKVSMQTFVVLALALTMGARLSVASVLAYLAEGALGLPVFQSGAGLAVFAGPTAGYLAGFVLAAAAVGWLAEHGALRSWPRALMTIALGEALIFLPGIAWLAVLFGADRALALGLLPFVPGMLLKDAMLLALIAGLRRSAAKRPQ